MLGAIRRAVGLVALAAVTIVASAASAQTPTEQIPPPVYAFKDAIGMDLSTGQFSASTASVSVGSQAHSLGMNFVYNQGGGSPNDGFLRMSYGGGQGSWVNNLDVLSTYSYGTTKINGVDTGTFILSIGDASELFTPDPNGTFNGLSGPWISAAGNGGAFDGRYYTTRGGTVVDFQPTSTCMPNGQMYRQTSCSCNGQVAQCQTLTRPDGEVLTYHRQQNTTNSPNWVGPRLQSITSSLGYQIHFIYDDANGFPNSLISVTAFDQVIDYCDPDAASCSFSSGKVWPTLTISTSSALSPGTWYASWSQTVTDSLNRQSVYWTANPTGAAPGAHNGNNWDQYFVTGGIYQMLRPTAQQAGGTPAITRSYTDDFQGHFTEAVSDGLHTWNYQLTQAVNGNWTGNANQQMIATDPAGHPRTLTFNTSDPNLGYLTRGRVATDTDALGNQTSYTYDPTTAHITDVTHPEGDRDHYDYDSHGDITRHTRYAATGSYEANAGITVVTSATYNNCPNPVTCAEPDTVTDANGNAGVAGSHVTYYTYDPTHGGVKTITSPAGANGVSPVTHYDYVQVAPTPRTVRAPSSRSGRCGVSRTRGSAGRPAALLP